MNSGVVVGVHGSIVDLRFDAQLPAIYSVLKTGAERQVTIEVLAQIDAQHVRGIALNSTQGLARGMPAEDSGDTLEIPVGKAILSRMLDVFGNSIARENWRTCIGVRCTRLRRHCGSDQPPPRFSRPVSR